MYKFHNIQLNIPYWNLRKVIWSVVSWFSRKIYFEEMIGKSENVKKWMMEIFNTIANKKMPFGQYIIVSNLNTLKHLHKRAKIKIKTLFHLKLIVKIIQRV